MLKRLGIQKRIMAYVSIGLAIMFGAFFYLGMQAVDRGTALVFEERLAIAQSVAAALGRDFNHVMVDAPHEMAEMARLTPESDAAALETAVNETFLHLAEVDSFPFFTVAGVSLLDHEGGLLASAPADPSGAGRRTLPVGLAQALAAETGPKVFWPDGGQPGQFVSISVPQRDVDGNIWMWALVDTEGKSTSEPFVPFGLMGMASEYASVETRQLPQQAQYHLEVLAPSGTTLLSVGSDETAGRQSSHYPLIKTLIEAEGSEALLHKVPAGGDSKDHVVAVVPVPLSDLYLALEQDTDVALALPNRFRRQLIIFGSVGFVVTLLVAWVTTRHVVKPTEELTGAAVRMAGGELSTPIRVKAQDEVGVLAENLETMRRQLKSALEEVETVNRELESRVQERTGQLQELVRRVLTAQEEERHRVALELHDETAQALTALTMALDSVVRRNDHLTPENAARLREARQIAADVLDGTRRLIYALRPVALQDMGLPAALRWYAEDSLDRAGVEVHVAAEGAESKVPDHVELALYRIGQEALSNVNRHANAGNVWITIAYQDSTVSLTVRDDGVGFDTNNPVEAVSRARGLGLAGMRERATLVNGRLAVESESGRGTTLRVEVPIEADGA